VDELLGVLSQNWPATSVSFNTPDTQRDGPNTVWQPMDHSLWS